MLLALTLIFFGARVIVGQTSQRSVVYQSAIELDGSGVVPAPAVDPLARRAAIAEAIEQGGIAVDAARIAVPVVPWNEHGLARVAIDLDARRWDDEREAYVVDLADGETAVLTLARDAQEHLESVLARYDEPGEAVVVMDPPTGRVIAIADGGEDEDLAPRLARRAPVWAASTFKVITGAALLETGAVTPTTETCYTGGSSGFDADDLEPEGQEAAACVSFTTAMARSSNLVFARQADAHLTPAGLQEVAERFGFNATIPFEAALEPSFAAIPDDRLEFARAAAGFRHTRMTPLHGALVQAAIANGGLMMVPTVVDRIETADGVTRYQHAPYEWRRVVSAETANALRTTQEETCTTGTARRDFGNRDGWPRSVQVWGKTGTLSNRDVPGVEPDPLYVYRWFTGIAEYEGREVSVAGLTVTTALWWIKGTYLASEAVLHTLQ